MVSSLVRLLTYPALLAGSVGAAALALRSFPVVPVVATINLAMAVLIALLERLHPYRADWARSHGDVQTDVLHLVLGMLPVPALFRALAFGALTAASVALAARVGHALWPSAWPLWAQLALALLVAEFGQYWVHRLAHERASLWRLHAVHHSAERLYWLNAGRFHPLDTLLQHAAEMAPLVLLGASPEVIALFTVFTSANGLLRHANVDLRTEWLNGVLSTADLHRWHHAVEVEHSNANYGANLIVWDALFGTRQAHGAEGPAQLGLKAAGFPRTFGALLLVPFRWRW